MILIKICGITNVEDAIACTELGANLLGFVFAESPRRVEVSTARHIRRVLGGDVRTVGVFTDESDDVVRIMDDCDLSFAQLHGGQSEDLARKIGAERVIRVARVRDAASVDALAQYQNAVFYLLDTYRAEKAGGTGEAFDWELAVRAKSFGKPVVLSGGLNPANVAAAIRSVRPAAVDASSRLESEPGTKDHQKVKEFIENVRKADSGS